MGTPTRMLGVDKGSGALTDINTVSGKIRTSSMPYLYDIAEGNIADHTPVIINGYSGDVDAADTTIADHSPNTQPYLTTAGTFEVGSSSSQDGYTYTGALTMILRGLGGTWGHDTSTVTLSGASQVSTGTALIRVMEAEVLTAGSSGKNAGTIDIRNGGNIFLRIDIGNNCSRAAIYTTASGYTAYLVGGYVTAVNNKPSQAKLTMRKFGGLFCVKAGAVLQDSGVSTSFYTPIEIPAKSDLEIRGTAVGGSGISDGVLFGWAEVA